MFFLVICSHLVNKSHCHPYHLLVDKVCNEACRRQAQGFVVSAKPSLKLEDQPLQDQLPNLWKLCTQGKKIIKIFLLRVINCILKINALVTHIAA